MQYLIEVTLFNLKDKKSQKEDIAKFLDYCPNDNKMSVEYLKN